MRDTIIIHCSATRAGQDFTAADIDRCIVNAASVLSVITSSSVSTARLNREGMLPSTEHIARDGIIGLSVSATLADWTGTVGLPTHERKRSVKHLSGW